MRNRAAMVARMTIATSKPKRSEIVADIAESLLSTKGPSINGDTCPPGRVPTLLWSMFLPCRGAWGPSGTQKSTGTCRPDFPALLACFCCYCTTPFLDRARGSSSTVCLWKTLEECEYRCVDLRGTLQLYPVTTTWEDCLAEVGDELR